MSSELVVHRVIIGIYIFALAIIKVLGSWVFIQFLVGTHLVRSPFQLFVPRFIFFPSCIAEELNKWNFERVLTTLLLIAPLNSVAT